MIFNIFMLRKKHDFVRYYIYNIFSINAKSFDVNNHFTSEVPFTFTGPTMAPHSLVLLRLALNA